MYSLTAVGNFINFHVCNTPPNVRFEVFTALNACSIVVLWVMTLSTYVDAHCVVTQKTTICNNLLALLGVISKSSSIWQDPFNLHGTLEKNILISSFGEYTSGRMIDFIFNFVFLSFSYFLIIVLILHSIL
jgi:hypothetical protein